MPKGVYRRVPGAPRLHARKQYRSIICADCQKLFQRPPSDTKRKYCSRACSVRHYRGANHSQFNDELRTDASGYQRRHGRLFEHRSIAERVLGRKLHQDECVHHLDGNKANNRNSNLLICSRAYHQWLHHEMGMRYAREHFGQIAA